MSTEVIYTDGSTSTFHGNGGSSHEGDLAIARLQLMTARSALQIYLKYNGEMQLTRDGHRLAVLNVIEPMSGQKFSTPTRQGGWRVSQENCREALACCEEMLWAIEHGAVVWDEG